MTTARGFLAISLLLLTLTPGRALGEDPPASQPAASRGQKLLDQGLAHYNSRRYHEAVKALQKAATAASEPSLLGRIHAHLGVCYFVINQRDNAVRAFTSALENSPALRLEMKDVGGTVFNLFEKTRLKLSGLLMASAVTPRAGLVVFVDGVRKGAAPWKGLLTIGIHRVRLETADGRWACEAPAVVGKDTTVTASCEPRLQTGLLTVSSKPAGARVLLGGKSLGQAPLTRVKVPVGEHTLLLRLAGHLQRRRTITLRRDEELKVTLALQRGRPGAKAAGNAVALRRQARARQTKTTWGYVSLGAGAALAASAAILYGVGFSQGAAAHDRYMSSFGADEMNAHYADVRSARGKLYAGHALAGVAAVAVGVSVYLLLTRPDAPRRASAGSRRALAPGVTATSGGLGFSVGGSF